MKIIKLCLLVIFSLSLYACNLSTDEKSADLQKTTKYQKNDISFSMPSNWKVTEDNGENSARYLFVESPGSAIMIINTYEKETAPSLQEYIESLTSERSNEKFFWGLGSLSNGSTSKIKRTINNHEVNAFKNEYAVNIAGINVLHISEFYSFYSKTHIAFVSSQTATEDLPLVADGFNLILSTFMWHENP